MSSQAAAPPRKIPSDTDIQDLYDAVWASYSEDQQSEKELENIYSVYEESPESPTTPSVTASSSHAPNGNAAQSSEQAKRSAPSARSQNGKERRPLPSVPGATSPSSATMTMPEPHPYRADSAASSAQHGNDNGRKLPTAPSNGGGSSSSSPMSSRGAGLPSDPRPAYRSHPSDGASYTTLNKSSSYRNALPTDSSATVSKNTSLRPSGAGAPTTPGYDFGDRMVSNGNHYYGDSKEDLDRSPSTGSYGSGLDRNLSVSSALTGYFANPGTTVDRSSSFATTVNRGKSTSSDFPEGLLPYPGDVGVYAHPGGSNTELAGSSNHQQEEYPTNAYAGGSAGAHVARGPLLLHDDLEGDYWEEEDEDDNRFVNFSLLSHIAVQLRDKVPRGTHVKGSIPWPRAFTGKDIVSTVQSQIQRELLMNHGISTNDRRVALQVARSLQSQLFFCEVEWENRVLQDGVEDVYKFLDDLEGGGDSAVAGSSSGGGGGGGGGHFEREELPTGVVTMLTKCYSPSCWEGSESCYSYSCPRRGQASTPALPQPEEPTTPVRPDWPGTVPQEVIRSLPDSEINRQTIIHKVISKEEQYVQDLDTVEKSFIKPLRMANPPVIRSDMLEDFIEDVFGNILDLRECNRRLLEDMYVRQREQHPVIQRIGDVFLEAATEFRLAYPIYVGHLPVAEKRMKEEIDSNPEFRLFLEQCSRTSARQQDAIRLDLKHFLNRPSEHLQKYPVLLEAIHNETAVGNPDADFLLEAIDAIKNLQTVAQLRTFQSSMGKGTPGKWEWHDLVSPEVRQGFTKEEAKRQAIIFELIKGEMAYVKDLENIEIMYVQPLRTVEPPVIPMDRVNQFIDDVFHNFAELHAHHRKMVEQFHDIQREEHPRIRSVTAAVYDAVLNFREAYMEYIPNYPIAAYRIDDEMENNPAFKAFVEQCVRHPDAHRLDMKNFINRPIPRLLRYELLLKGILEETPAGHDDVKDIPEVLELIKALGKETEPGVVSSKTKVELWRYNSNLMFKPGEAIDMDLLDEHRSLIHAGKLLRQPETGFEWSGWSELFVLLFDNYLVMTKPKERDGVTKYRVDRRPIPLDLLTLANFTDPPTQRSTGILRGLRGGERDRHGDTAMSPAGLAPENGPTDSRSVYPCTLHHNGRLGGLYTLYAETAQVRAEWKQKLEEAIGLRKVVQESNKVFEVETLSSDTFLVPSMVTGAITPSWNHENSFTGKVTCSVPFNTPDGRGLVAIGCAEGVWIGYRHDSRSMRRVLHLKQVTQCAMLEDFAIFLVLADKALFAYHLEALVPSAPHNSNISQTPQKLNGSKDVHFFSVGNLLGRTLVIYMKKKGVDSVFRVLEPVVERINDRTRAPAGLGSRLGIRSPRSEWFRVYRDFFLPCESFDLIFLKAKIAILCTKGFEIMDLSDFQSVTIPQRDDPKLEKLARRCDSCRPMGMFRSNDDEFLLCYDEFGLYVDKHGDPSRSTGTIEWEGTAERVALHHPYVLLFDRRFIEIRHLETGRLAQIMSGNDVRCIWDGRGSAQQAGTTPGPDGLENMVQEARVHGVMIDPEPVMQPGTNRPARAVAQQVFELIPTIPLYLPGSLASPSTSTYFPMSHSPPRSPPLRSSDSWRS